MVSSIARRRRLRELKMRVLKRSVVDPRQANFATREDLRQGAVRLLKSGMWDSYAVKGS